MITGPDYCITSSGDNELACTVPFDDAWSDTPCPASEFIAEDTGEHYVIVMGSECCSEAAPYIIGVDADTDPGLMQLADDIDLASMEPIVYQVSGTATITTE